MSFNLLTFTPAGASSQFQVTSTGIRSADVEVITLLRMFDRETEPSLRFFFWAYDMGTPTRSDNVEICITILVSNTTTDCKCFIYNNQQDCNDNPPVILNTPYTAIIYEDDTITPLGTQLFTLATSDLDIGDNADHHFHIETGDGFGLFQINEDTGLVTTAGHLDYEVHPNRIDFDVSGPLCECTSIT